MGNFWSSTRASRSNRDTQSKTQHMLFDQWFVKHWWTLEEVWNNQSPAKSRESRTGSGSPIDSSSSLSKSRSRSCAKSSSNTRIRLLHPYSFQSGFSIFTSQTGWQFKFSIFICCASRNLKSNEATGTNLVHSCSSGELVYSRVKSSTKYSHIYTYKSCAFTIIR